MEFDKSKVYTALNANELKEGDKVLLANSLEVLTDLVENDESPTVLTSIAPENHQYRFIRKSGFKYALAYFVFSPPKKPKYKPFSDTETAYKTISAHGGWIKTVTGEYLMITGIDIGVRTNKAIFVKRHWYSTQAAFDSCIFADDGSPLGEKVEDDDNNAE